METLRIHSSINYSIEIVLWILTRLMSKSEIKDHKLSNPVYCGSAVHWTFFTLKKERSITARRFNNELSVLAWLTFHENLLIDADSARNKSPLSVLSGLNFKVDTVAGNMTYTFYVKTCAFEKECKDKICGRIDPGIPHLKITKCDSACCKTNLCNDGAGISIVSGFTLFTCAVLALTRSAVSKDWCVGF